jgi:membrane-anchored glycerophosphoryl diester phosphodiesterase (GDPDase)
MKKILNFSFRKNIKESWLLYKNNFWGLVLVNLVISILVYVINPEVKSSASLANPLINFSALNSLISIIVFSFITCFIIKYSLNILATEKVKIFSRQIKNLIPSFKVYLNVLVNTIIYSIIVSIGLVLLIFPGLYLTGRLFFSFYLIIDRKMNAFKAIKSSWQMTKGLGWRILGNVLKVILLSIIPILLSVIIVVVLTLIFPKMSLVLGTIIILFMIILGYVVSSLFTAPIGTIFLAKLYREFEEENNTKKIKEIPDQEAIKI